MSRSEFEVLYGGQAGGGKTFGIIMEAVRNIEKPGYKGLILRRTFPQLQEIIDTTFTIYPSLGGVWRSIKKRWEFPNDVSIRLRHMRRAEDRYDFKGDQYQYIGMDEASEFTENMYLYLFSRCRSIDPKIKCKFRAGSNPGGPGHSFLKNRFRIGNLTPKTTIIDPVTGLDRIFIPARISDNPFISKNDPDYVKRLMSLSEIERGRLLEGNWDIFLSQAFPELNYDIHAIDDFEIPKEWTRYLVMDWGYSTPFALLWIAIDFDGKLYVYREWYGNRVDSERGANVGLKLSPAEISRGIRERQQTGEKVISGPCDPDMFNPRWKVLGKRQFGIVGGSPADDFAQEGFRFLKADNNRKLGRQQVHKRLELDEDGTPMIFIFKSCKDFWRTIPLLREDEKDPDLILSKSEEDHLYSCLRYFCMFKPVKPHRRVNTEKGTFAKERERFIKARRLSSQIGIGMDEAYLRLKRSV